MSDRATILAVDDTSEVLTLLVRVLTLEGHDVRAAESGELALAAISASPPDLILLDVRMKGMSGLEVCQRLKSAEATRPIPIILISAFADVDDWVQGLRLGASDYITKPFQPEELRTRVRTHLALRNAKISLETQTSKLRQVNKRLELEIGVRQQTEVQLRRSLGEAERARRALVSVLEDHRAAAEQLRRSEEHFRELFEASCDAIMILEPPHWTLTAVNPAAFTIFRTKDPADLLFRHPSELSPETQQNGVQSSVAAKELLERTLRDGVAAFEWIHKRVDGEAFFATVKLVRMERNGSLRIQATVRDISEQKRLEAELGHSRKLEAVGQLAAGIAHEINTPSQFVGDGLQFLKEAFEGYQCLLKALQSLPSAALEGDLACAAVLGEMRKIERDIDLTYLNENVPGTLERCIDGVSRIAAIVRAMKEFAHPDQRQMAPADLNHALQNTLTIARNEYKYIADVDLQLGALPPVFCHIGDLNQVFLNLIVNAAHAIGDTVHSVAERGLIRISTARDGDWVQVEITDSGTGIPESVRGRIFEPFFTTKEIGKGSGQGLAIAHSIVTLKHHGSLTFKTEVGVGTTFIVKLPLDGIRDESIQCAPHDSIAPITSEV